MEKEKVLEVEFVKVFDKWAFRITYQDEKVLERGKFEDNELKVYSHYGPYYSSYNNLSIRGESYIRDNDILICDDKGKSLIEEKVNAINEKYGKPKRWRAKFNEFYFFIKKFGNVGCYKEDGDEFDNNLYNFGNYFQTEEEAEIYLKKIRKLLKERE